MGAGYSGIWVEGDAKADPWRTKPAHNSGSTNRSRTCHRCILGGSDPHLGPWPWEACFAETLPLTLPLLILWLNSSHFLLFVLNGDHEIPTFQGCVKYSVICKMLHKWGNFRFLFSSYNPKVKNRRQEKGMGHAFAILVSTDARMPLSAGIERRQEGMCSALWYHISALSLCFPFCIEGQPTAAQALSLVAVSNHFKKPRHQWWVTEPWDSVTVALWPYLWQAFLLLPPIRWVTLSLDRGDTYLKLLSLKAWGRLSWCLFMPSCQFSRSPRQREMPTLHTARIREGLHLTYHKHVDNCLTGNKKGSK